jgi:hypothetical protein
LPDFFAASIASSRPTNLRFDEKRCRASAPSDRRAACYEYTTSSATKLALLAAERGIGLEVDALLQLDGVRLAVAAHLRHAIGPPAARASPSRQIVVRVKAFSKIARTTPAE